MAAGATKPSSTPLFSPSPRQGSTGTSSSGGDWVYEFSQPGSARTATSPAVRVRFARTIGEIATSVSGTGSFTVNVKVNGVTAFTTAVTAGSVYSASIPLAVGNLLTVQIASVTTSGLSNFWIGMA